MNLRVLKKALDRFAEPGRSVQIASAENGLDAFLWFVQFRKERDDDLVLFMDLEMPVMDGRASALTIRDVW